MSIDGKKLESVLFHTVCIFILVVFFDIFIFRHLLGFGSVYTKMNYNEFDKVAQPYAYFVHPDVARATKGNILYDGSSLWYPEPPGEKTLKIALFGGSTAGYPDFGTPGSKTMPQYLADRLNEKFNGNVAIANFGSSGGHHRQHLHMLFEFLPEYKPDIVLYYGGNNETALYIDGYDPRPGYPINFFYKEEFSTWKKFLLENSAIIGAWYDRFGSSSDIAKLREKAGFESPEWNQEMVDKYFESLEFSQFVSTSFKSEYFKGNTRFVAFFQPFKPLDEANEWQIKEIRKQIPSYKYLHDIHDAYDGLGESIYYDNCHVNDEANRHMAELLAEKIMGLIP